MEVFRDAEVRLVSTELCDGSSMRIEMFQGGNIAFSTEIAEALLRGRAEHDTEGIILYDLEREQKRD